MSVMSRNLPYEQYELVIIHGLKSAQHYNTQTGVIQGFIDEKNRFEVHVKGKAISVAPQNLKPVNIRDGLSFLDGSHYAEDLQFQIVENVLRLNFAETSEENAFYACRLMFHNFLHNDRENTYSLEKSLLAIRKFYKDMMNQHYGLLPFVATLLIWWEDKCNVEHTETVFEDVMEVLSNGLHNPRIDKLEFFRVWFDCHFLRSMSENNFMKGIIAAKSISNQSDISEITLYLEAYNAFKNPSASAMRYLIVSQSQFALQNGIEQNVMYHVYIAKARTFLALMDPERARRNLKKVRKYEQFMTMHRRKIICKFLSEMERDIEHFSFPKQQFQVEYPTETPMKCCNPMCKKHESSLKEFQMCPCCRRAVYCGRKCQKAHFHIHSRFCFEWQYDD